MASVNLSYIIATYNRLPFLKITLEKLVNELLPDEEIVIVDGNSTDGTKDYLQQLFVDCKIQCFISEPDKNQAHAWNKALLLAKGIIIKKIIDDDVFCYPAIRKCTAYMLEHTTVDVVISNDLSSSLHNSTVIEKCTRLPQFKKWGSGLVPSFTFSDVNMLIRRSSLAYIGLYNTSFTMMDWEYALRISYQNANIAYYTGYNALSVAHPQTVTSLVNKETIKAEGKRAQIFYEYAGDNSEISYWSKIKIAAGEIIYSKKQNAPALLTDVNARKLQLVYDHYYDYLNSLYNEDAQFLISV
jgi:glycosyltransferase involved in cell wall biosynthesis